MSSKCAIKPCPNWKVTRKDYCETRKFLSTKPWCMLTLTKLDLCKEPNDCSKNVVSDSRPFCLDRKSTYSSSPKLRPNPWKLDNLCTFPECTKERCQYGKHFEYVCRNRKFQVQPGMQLRIADIPPDYTPPCAVNACTERSSVPSTYCELRELICTYSPWIRTDISRCLPTKELSQRS